MRSPDKRFLGIFGTLAIFFKTQLPIREVKNRAIKLQFVTSFQLPLYLAVITVNSYCLLVLCKNKDLQNLDYFLVALQSISDLVFTGILGCIDYFLDVWSVFIYFCSYAGFTPYDDYTSTTTRLSSFAGTILATKSSDCHRTACKLLEIALKAHH